MSHMTIWGRSFLGIVMYGLLALRGNSAVAQIVPDRTLPNNSRVTTVGNIRTIEGGTQAGGNLFHSFQEFSVPNGSTAHFNNTLDIQNIISRVTGGSISNIDGLIRANGTANLFFINPNGIIFGSNASLQIGGSFVASTANSLKFADGTEFSATNPQAPPLLTISVPSGLQFGSNPGEIVNLSQASPNNAVNIFGLPVGLQVKSGRTLALVGGNVSLNGGNLTAGDNLTAAGGRIELGSVASGGLVNLNEIETGYALGYAGVKNFGDIQLSQIAVVDASGSSGGAIQLQGRNINLSGNSIILSVTSGSQRGGDLAINASGSVNLSGGSQIGTFAQSVGQAGDTKVTALDSVELAGKAPDGSPSLLGSQVCPLLNCQSVTGNGGNLTIETGKLLVRDGAIIDSATFGAGKAGNIIVNARDAIELRGAKSGIFAEVGQDAIDDAGNAGTLTIETKQLTVLGGAQISTAARKGGQGGDLTINASDSILLSGFSPLATADLNDPNRSGIFVSAQPGATGNVGNLNLKTGLLTVEKGAFLSAANLGTGKGGTANLNVRQLVIRDGGNVNAGSFSQGPGSTLTINATDSVQVIGTGTIAFTPVNSTLSAQALASGKAGDLNITTRNLNIQDGASATVSSPSGLAGNLTVTAKDIRLNQGSLTAETAITGGEEGAKINLQGLDFLLLQNNSLISAQASGNARGGNITIDADTTRGFVVAPPLQNSDIIASASFGNGGNITINARQIFGLTQGKANPPNRTNDIDASGQFNLSGIIIDPSLGLAQLPTVVVNTPKLVSSGCAAASDNSFTITGRGGLPPSPTEPLSSDVVWTDARLPAVQQHSSNKPKAKPHSKPKAEPIAIVPTTGWVFNKEKGEVTLISSAPSATGLGSNPATCSTR